jgi:hypothetical protein
MAPAFATGEYKESRKRMPIYMHSPWNAVLGKPDEKQIDSHK